VREEKKIYRGVKMPFQNYFARLSVGMEFTFEGRRYVKTGSFWGRRLVDNVEVRFEVWQIVGYELNTILKG
jgi:hypothetical protein